MKILVIEDEAKVLTFIGKGLKSSEMTVDLAGSLDEAFANFLSSQYDVIVLDRLMSGVDAVKSIPKIKECCPAAKIIVLSALSEVDDKVDGLTAGADDYLGKPFHISELVARIRALTRRITSSPGHRDNMITYQDVIIKLDTQRVDRAGTRIELTPKEYKLLVFLMNRPNRVFSKTDIINSVWELQYYPESNVVEVVVNHLRNKLDKGFEKQLIHSRRGVGYWLGDSNI